MKNCKKYDIWYIYNSIIKIIIVIPTIIIIFWFQLVLHILLPWITIKFIFIITIFKNQIILLLLLLRFVVSVLLIVISLLSSGSSISNHWLIVLFLYFLIIIIKIFGFCISNIPNRFCFCLYEVFIIQNHKIMKISDHLHKFHWFNISILGYSNFGFIVGLIVIGFVIDWIWFVN